MIDFPCAKINLGLNVTNKRPDGYHDLETVFTLYGCVTGWKLKKYRIAKALMAVAGSAWTDFP